MTHPFQTTLENFAIKAERHIGSFLDERVRGEMYAPMKYALLNGGKRIRAYLVMQSAALYGANEQDALCVAGAIESIHAYSLIHDDLPCMDDDDLRRGQPTVHIKWDEATAILTGDALHSFAVEFLCNLQHTKVEYILDLINTLAQASGSMGMVLGQAQDMAVKARQSILTLEDVSTLQKYKTGALIEWSAMAGGRMMGKDINALRAYAAAVGLAFQIQDDILDVEGDVAYVGKRLQKDAKADKATFVSLLGIEAAKIKARELIAKAEDSLLPFGQQADGLRSLAHYIISRNK